MTEEEIAIAQLKKLLNPGDKVYCILRWVNGVGDNRIVDFHCVSDGEVRWLSGYISRLWSDNGGFERTEKHGGGLFIGGSGMDAANEVLYALGNKLFDDGYALKREWL
jgi:hypothetical protein